MADVYREFQDVSFEFMQYYKKKYGDSGIVVENIRLPTEALRVVARGKNE